MALYLGREKLEVNINGVKYCVNLFSTATIGNAIRLSTQDGYILKDSNGLYLITKDGDE